MRLKITRIDESLPLPSYQTAGSSGLDLYSRETHSIEPGEIKLLPSNIIVQTPKGYAFIVALRSSTPRKKGLSVPHGFGLVDSDFYGSENEIMIQVYNFTNQKVVVERGERIAQGFVIKTPILKLVEVKNNKPSRGFSGSTGNK